MAKSKKGAIAEVEGAIVIRKGEFLVVKGGRLEPARLTDVLDNGLDLRLVVKENESDEG